MSVETAATEDGGEVTFIGGKAVEQTTQGETPDGAHGDELAAAKVAVKKALSEGLKEEGRQAAKEAKASREKDPLVPRDRGDDGKFIPNPGEEGSKKARASEDAEEASALRKALQERKEGARYKAEANAELERSRQEVRQIHQQVLRERQELQAERARMQQLRTDPIRAIKENGWDPEAFILDIAQDGTPEGQARRQQRALEAQLQELRDWKQSQADAQVQAQRQAQQQGAKQYRQQVEQTFLQTSFGKTGEGEDTHPHLASFYKGHEVGLLAEADVVAEQYRNVTGKEATLPEIAEYLEERAAKWYKSMSGRGQAAPQVSQGRPTQGSATGRKSLSPQGSSERRSLGNTLKDLDGDERLEAAKEAVRAAFHASGER